jgi:hypothetical protein
MSGRIADLWGFNCRSLPHLDSLRYRAKRRDFVGIRVRNYAQNRPLLRAASCPMSDLLVATNVRPIR